MVEVAEREGDFEHDFDVVSEEFEAKSELESEGFLSAERLVRGISLFPLNFCNFCSIDCLTGTVGPDNL